ncbi:transcriptional regulator CynR [Pseudomonas aeruginosa NCMG1179]|nr:transcriptional regulator CynR [Pseudomonas aeruginosa NCMG1179]
MPHLLRQGRLRNVQRLGGAGEVAMLGDSEQVAQVAKQHGNIQL